MELVPFMVTVFVLGFFMALGKAAVYKHIPVYYPKNVGAVGGLVGMIGGLGGFVLPIAFGALNDLTGLWTSCFMLLFLRGQRRAGVDARLDPPDGARRRGRRCAAARTAGNAGDPRARAYRRAVGRGADRLAPGGQDVLGEDRPRDRPAQPVDVDPGAAAVVRDLAGVVGGGGEAACRSGSNSPTTELFWLAALPGISGAVLRIFYSFMVPIFGGRLWTTLATWSLMIPAVGIGYAVQTPARRIRYC